MKSEKKGYSLILLMNAIYVLIFYFLMSHFS